MPKVKFNSLDKYKAGLVAEGFHQIPRLDFFLNLYRYNQIQEIKVRMILKFAEHMWDGCLKKIIHFLINEKFDFLVTILPHSRFWHLLSFSFLAPYFPPLAVVTDRLWSPTTTVIAGGNEKVCYKSSLLWLKALYF